MSSSLTDGERNLERMNRPYRYCTKCGSDVGSSYSFCVSCGAGIKRRVRSFGRRVRNRVSFQRKPPVNKLFRVFKVIFDWIIGIFIITTVISGVPGFFLAIFVYLTYKNIHKYGKKQEVKRRRTVIRTPVYLKPKVQPVELTRDQKIILSIKQGNGDILSLSNHYTISLRELRKLIRQARDNGELVGWYSKKMDYFITKQELKKILRAALLSEKLPMNQLEGFPMPPRGQLLRQSIL